MKQLEIVYPPSSDEDREKETRRVIQHVLSRQVTDHAQTLIDLAKGADGEPQLDKQLLLQEAAWIKSKP